MQLGTPQIFNRHPLSTTPSSSLGTDHLPPAHPHGSPTPNPSSIRARFCRVHRQINGVANTGRYMCPSPPPLVRPVHPPSPCYRRSAPSRWNRRPTLRAPTTLSRCLSATLYRVIIKFPRTDTKWIVEALACFRAVFPTCQLGWLSFGLHGDAEGRLSDEEGGTRFR